MDQRSRWALPLLLTAASVSAAGPVYADVTVSGDVTPSNPSDPWDLGPNPLLIGSTSQFGAPTSGEVVISKGGTLISSGAIVAANDEATGTVHVTGYGSRWINSGSLWVALLNETMGQLYIRRGAEVITDSLQIGIAGYSANGYVLVEGYDSALTSRTDTYIGYAESDSYLELRQGGSFYSHNVYIARCQLCSGHAIAGGSATTWVNTGEFVVGANGHGTLLVEQDAKLFTVNARIHTTDDMVGYHTSRALVRGWGATWTNEGLLRVGDFGYGELRIGAYGSLVTEDTEVRSLSGNGVLEVNGPYASWRNSGDVMLVTAEPTAPALLIRRGLASIGGALRTGPLHPTFDPPHPGPVALVTGGALVAGLIDLPEGDFHLAGGRLAVGSFVGDLVNVQSGELSVGEEHPSTTVSGGYIQGPGAALAITVAGASGAPLLQVDADVSLDGVLEVLPADETASFQAGDTVALLGWNGELTGVFADVYIALPLPPGLAWDTSALYTTGEITVVPS
ncbi:hypothetical protein SOCE26_080850 [Sorangium cellulosum]|uniref:Secreted protein n=1 Tax=Sorangium cellulosum TaxID=56 RepID=A0A2L0F569_SORCE|nr:hypothetical protein [Sorangium cellulosum]AUX46579.1 hypothetical protein SOCE26_080850 [Sorangium cellulosum]